MHQWSETYPGEYSTIRTRTGPKCRVRQNAHPRSPLCSVGATVDQSVVPNGIPDICMANTPWGDPRVEKPANDATTQAYDVRRSIHRSEPLESLMTVTG